MSAVPKNNVQPLNATLSLASPSKLPAAFVPALDSEPEANPKDNDDCSQHDTAAEYFTPLF